MRRDPKPYHILVIEDNIGDYTLISDFLEEQIVDPQITRAKTYLEARKILQEKHSEIQVILLDLSLPDKNGEDLIQNIITYTKELPVIVLTGYSDVSFGVKSLLMGVSDYLLKDELNAITLYKTIIYNLERKKILNNLQESEKRYSELFHLSPQPMFVYDIETLAFLDVNQSATEHYGYTSEDFLNMKIKDILSCKNVSCESKKNPEIVTKNSSSGNEIIHRKKNGETISVDIRSNDIFFKGVKARVILVNDVTERLEYINAIEKQNEKLKSIGWIQSHLVRAPLARIMGIIGLINEEVVTEQEKKELLVEVLNSAKEFDVIIRDIVTQAEQVHTSIDHEI